MSTITSETSSNTLCNQISNALHNGEQLPSITVTDIADTLVCRHFDFADISSPQEIRQCRGTIEDIDGKVVCRSFGFTPEYPLHDSESINKYVVPFLTRENIVCIPSFEGTLIRVFYYSNKWYISTHKKIDAKASKWGCDVSFGELFEKAYKNLYNVIAEDHEIDIQDDMNKRLDKDHVYIYLLRNYFENRIVCNATYDHQTVLLGTIIRTTTENEDQESIDTYRFELDDDKLRLNLTSIQDINQFVEQINITTLQGIVLIDCSTLECIKVINNVYWFYYTLRKNQPNVVFRFIELVQEQTSEEHYESFNQRVNKKKNETCVSTRNVKHFQELYPEYADCFTECLRVLDKIAINIYRKYRNRFVRKQITFVPQEQYYMMKELHEQFITSGKKNIITQQRVVQHIYSQPTSRVYLLYTKYVERKRDWRW